MKTAKIKKFEDRREDLRLFAQRRCQAATAVHKSFGIIDALFIIMMTICIVIFAWIILSVIQVSQNSFVSFDTNGAETAPFYRYNFFVIMMKIVGK